VDTDRLFRRMRWAGLVFWVAGGVLLLIAMARGVLWSPLSLLGVLFVIVALVLHAVHVVDRMYRFRAGKQQRSRSLFEPTAYVCPECGYALRGLQGIQCPECGTIRPSPLDEHQDV